MVRPFDCALHNTSENATPTGPPPPLLTTLHATAGAPANWRAPPVCVMRKKLDYRAITRPLRRIHPQPAAAQSRHAATAR